jgi:hypothetical protein
MYHYRLGNADIASALVLPGLPDAEISADPVITIRRAPPEAGCEWVPHAEGAEFTPDWSTIDHLRSADGAWYRIRYDYSGHWADFSIRADGREVTVAAGEGEDDAEVANLIEGPILGRALRLAGAPCLHATALAVDGRAVALMGASGVGKSSLAWALVQQGCRLVTDDMVGLAAAPEGLMVQPGRARLRMWPDTARRLGVEGGDSRVLFPTTSEMDKIGVRDPNRFAGGPVRLHAIFKVLPRDPLLATPHIAEMPPGQRLAELAANLHGMIVPGRAARQRELALLAKVVAQVPVRTLTLPDNLDRLTEMAAALRLRLFE